MSQKPQEKLTAGRVILLIVVTGIGIWFSYQIPGVEMLMP